MADIETMFDQVVEHYIQQFRPKGSNISDFEMENIFQSVKKNIRDEVMDFIEEEERKKILNKIEGEAKDYRKKLFRKVKVTIIVETIFVAFLVGLIVNQVTSLIPQVYCWGVIILSFLACVLLIFLETKD